MIPTQDYEAIKRIFNDKRIYDYLVDDLTPEDIEPPQGCVYLLSEDGDGLVMVIPRNSVEAEVHIAVLPEARHRAFYYGKKALDWIFEQNVHKVTAMIPQTNQQVYKYCLKLGFQQEGVNRMSFLKDGKLQDQWLIGLTKEEWLCHH